MSKQKASGNPRPAAKAVLGFNLEAGDESIETIDISQLANDPELQAELIALGWNDNHGSNHVVHEKKADTHSVLQADEEPLLDLTGIGDLNEDEITLSAEDLNDPDLLNMYNSLCGEPSSSDGAENIKNKAPVKEVDVSSSQVSKPMKVSDGIQLAQKRPNPSTNMDYPALSSSSSSSSSASSSSSMTAEQAKTMALKYKREGNNEEALKYMRLSKQLETAKNDPLKLIPDVKLSTDTVAKIAATKPSTSSVLSPTTPIKQPTSTVSPATSIVTPTSSRDAAFESLESAIVEASNTALAAAKSLRESDPITARDKLREYKKYQQELAVLQARKVIPNALPPFFRWKTTRKEEKV